MDVRNISLEKLCKSPLLVVLFCFVLIAFFSHLLILLSKTTDLSLLLGRQSAAFISFGILVIAGVLMLRGKLAPLSFDKRNCNFLFYIIALCPVVELLVNPLPYYFEGANEPSFLIKVALSLSFIGLFFTRALLPIFVCILYVLYKSYDSVLGNYSLTAVKPFFDILIAWGALLFLEWKTGNSIAEPIKLIVILIIHVSNYLIPGIAKLEIGENVTDWLFYNDLSNLMIAARVNGWGLFGLENDLFIALAGAVNRSSVVLMVPVLFVQVVCFLAFFHKRLSIFFLICFECLHIGIFIFSGIFFFTWIYINLILIFWVKRTSFKFDFKNGISAVVLCFLSPLFISPPSLAWFDTPYNISYEIIDLSDNQTIDVGNFRPYDVMLTQNRLNSLDIKVSSMNTYGQIHGPQLFLADGEYFRPIKTILKEALGFQTKPFRQRPGISQYKALLECGELECAQNLTSRMINKESEHKSVSVAREALHGIVCKAEPLPFSVRYLPHHLYSDGKSITKKIRAYSVLRNESLWVPSKELVLTDKEVLYERKCG